MRKRREGSRRRPKSRAYPLVISAAWGSYAGRKLHSIPARFMPALRKSSKWGRAPMKHLPMIGLALLAPLSAGQANAEELTGTLKNIKETGAITLGSRDSSIPFSYLDDSQKPIGFAMDICYKIVDAVH